MKKSATIVMIMTLALISSNSTMAGGRYYYDRGHDGHHYGGHRGHYPGTFLGGVIVGGVIGSQFIAPSYRRPIHANTYPPTIVAGSNFLLKSNGDCFLMTEKSNGNQILSSVPASNCQ